MPHSREADISVHSETTQCLAVEVADISVHSETTQCLAVEGADM